MLFAINLLPPEDQRKIEKDRTLRFLIVGLFGMLLFLITSLILLLPTYLFLTVQSRELARQLALEKQSPELHRAEAIESAIQKLNIQAEAVLQNRDSLRNPSIAIESVINQKPQGVNINSFNYREEKAGEDEYFLTLSGHATRRDILLDFVEDLKKEKRFGSVHSPVSNILSKEKVEFSLVVSLNAVNDDN